LCGVWYCMATVLLLCCLMLWGLSVSGFFAGFFGVWGVFLGCFDWCYFGGVQLLFCLEGTGVCEGCDGRFWVCIRAPFGMNRVVLGAFSGSFRVVEGFPGSDV